METFREILMTVGGVTPQLVTETLYYLTRIEQPPVMISEMFVLTTLPGRDRIRTSLLDPSHGHFWAFCREYGLDPSSITFGVQSIVVLNGSDGEPLVDIRTDADNETVADQILEFIRQRTADPETRLHCSIAGGRKTQSLYLGFALQLYGRPQDRLLHVLVSEDFEAHSEFFPPKTRRRLRTKAGRFIDTSQARVELAQIPFLRLRDKLPGGVGALKPLISSLQQMLDLLPLLPAVRVELRQRKLVIGNVVVQLEPMQVVLYEHLARARQGAVPTRDREIGVGEAGYVFIADLDGQRDVLLGRYGTIYGSHSEMYKRLAKRWERAIDADTIRIHFAKINRKIRQAVQDEAKALHYIVTSVGAYGDTRYGIRLPGDKIEVVE